MTNYGKDCNFGVNMMVQKLFSIEIRRLLLIIGLLVTAIVVSQLFSFPFGKNNFNADPNKVTISLTNARNSQNHSRPTEIQTENSIHSDPSDSDDEIDAIEVDVNSSQKSVPENGQTTETRFQIEMEISRDNASGISPSKPDKRIGQRNEKFIDPKIINTNFKPLPSSVYEPIEWRKKPITLLQMNALLLESSHSRSKKPRRSSERDCDLLSAKREIEKAPIIRNITELSPLVFRNVSMFKRSYELMERVLRIYIYKEGDWPVFHQPYMRGIYASEGWFMKLMESNKKFVVRDPKKAHLFFLPFSVSNLRFTLGKQQGVEKKDLEKYLTEYVELIARKHRFWNRTGGADHFFLACHDWGSHLTRKTMKNCIRSLCNANVAKDFKIGKDTSSPVTYIRSSKYPLENLGGKPVSKRAILAFFAGGMHGYLRPLLLQHWADKEPDMKIFGPMARDVKGKKVYREFMKSSKYCICARGYQVHTPRVVESIFYECVPVIISDNYVPPFFEVLNWGAFAVFVQERDVPNLRKILLSIPKERYEALQMGVKMVQKHFFWHKTPLRYDLFHMTLHSVWHNRLLQLQATSTPCRS